MVFSGAPCEPNLTQFFEDQKMVRRDPGGEDRRRDEAEENSIYSPIDLGGGFRTGKHLFFYFKSWYV
jgi:hypothetical protein